MKILFFSIHSSIWQHAFPEALVAKALIDGGHNVVHAWCDGLFDKLCICMVANGLSLDSDVSAKQRICSFCKQNKSLLQSKFSFNGVNLEDFLDSTEVAFIDTEISRLSPNDYYDYEHNGIPIGRLSIYETMLRFKKNTLRIESDIEADYYKTWLKNAFCVAVAAPKIIEHIKPDKLLIYSNTYSSNNVINFYAKDVGIDSYSMTAWDNLANFYRGLNIVKGYNLEHYHGLFNMWEKVKHKHFPSKLIKKILPHMLSQIHAKTFVTYSKGKQSDKNILDYFKISKNQKIVSAMMSSYDEIIASYAIGEFTTHETRLFKNQAEWIGALIEYFKVRPDLFLIIRVHPREFPNHREGQKSKNAELYEKLLTNLPSNIVVNWPSDNISVYDLAEHVDLVLNGFSSSGLEMALLGIPVLSYANEWNTYPIDLDTKINTRDDLFASIDRLIDDGWSFERIKLAYRWLAFKFFIGSFDISDGFMMQPGEPVRKYADLSVAPKSIEISSEICRFIESGAINHADILDFSIFDDSGEEEELEAILETMRIVYANLYTNQADLYHCFKKFADNVRRDYLNRVGAEKSSLQTFFKNFKNLRNSVRNELKKKYANRNPIRGKLYSKMTKFLKEISCPTQKH